MSYELNDIQRDRIKAHENQCEDIMQDLTGSGMLEALGDSSGSYWERDRWVSTQGIANAIARAYELGLRHGREET